MDPEFKKQKDIIEVERVEKVQHVQKTVIKLKTD
jgi:hypothetical protein